MLLYIALTGTLNLCVGYALGVYIGEFPPVPGLPFRRKPVDPPEPTIDLTAPADAPAAPSPQAAPEPQPAPQPQPQPVKADPKEVLQDLEGFQAKLAAMGSEMKASADDSDAFNDCASRLQQANHDYLEHAQHSIEGLSIAADDERAADCRQIVEENVERVGRTSERIDSLLAAGPPDEQARGELIEQTGELSKAVESAGKQLAARVEPAAANDPANEPEAAEPPPAGAEAVVLAQFERIEKVIDDALERGGEDPLIVAAIRRDPISQEDGQPTAELENLVHGEIIRMAKEVFDLSPLTSQCEDQLLVVLEGQRLQDASERVESLRQQVEKTTFVAGEGKLHATLTCAVAEAVEEPDRERLFHQLEEALSESEQHGTNRSYHHDGHFPAPLAAAEVKVEERTVTLA